MLRSFTTPSPLALLPIFPRSAGYPRAGGRGAESARSQAVAGLAVQCRGSSHGEDAIHVEQVFETTVHAAISPASSPGGLPLRRSTGTTALVTVPDPARVRLRYMEPRPRIRTTAMHLITPTTPASRFTSDRGSTVDITAATDSADNSFSLMLLLVPRSPQWLRGFLFWPQPVALAISSPAILFNGYRTATVRESAIKWRRAEIFLKRTVYFKNR